MFFGLRPKTYLKVQTLEQIVNSPATCITCKCKMHIRKCKQGAHYKLNELNLNSKTSCGLGIKNLL